jgi:hypothetical protein
MYTTKLNRHGNGKPTGNLSFLCRFILSGIPYRLTDEKSFFHFPLRIFYFLDGNATHLKIHGWGRHEKQGAQIVNESHTVFPSECLSSKPLCLICCVELKLELGESRARPPLVPTMAVFVRSLPHWRRFYGGSKAIWSAGWKPGLVLRGKMDVDGTLVFSSLVASSRITSSLVLIVLDFRIPVTVCVDLAVFTPIGLLDLPLCGGGLFFPFSSC